jgi:hypothetical protein
MCKTVKDKPFRLNEEVELISLLLTNNNAKALNVKHSSLLGG